jgi:transposase InsO family protein
MKTYMNDNELKRVDQVREFLLGSASIAFTPAASKTERYTWLAKSLRQFNYHNLRKRDKGVIRQYLKKMTGYSRQQLTRLLAEHRKSRTIGSRGWQRSRFGKRYTEADILLLAEMDACHQTLSGPATKKLFERGYKVFDDTAYERLAGISISHLYNLRGSLTYQQHRRYFTKTQRTMVPIGERRKPNPCGEPGYLRIDTVHQGDQDGHKGVYHINAVDAVTQMEVVCAVERITRQHLIPALEMMIEFFPFKIKGIHTDNGSEYINKMVASLLKKLLIELTKSRSCHSNDNALVEGKNGAIVRKYLGHIHIPQRYAPRINEFYEKHLNPYINYHRPCYFAVTVTDAKGKERKTYPYDQMMTPYEKLKSLPDASNYLKCGITFTMLDEVSTQETDMEAGRKTQQGRKELFLALFKEQGGQLQLR